MNIAFDKDYINHKLKAGGYRNASEVVREALRRMEAEEAPVSAELEAELIKGLESGPARPMPANFWSNLRKSVRKKSRGASSR